MLGDTRHLKTCLPLAASHTRKKTAFVLAGGGSLGAVEAGMLRVLVAAGEMPDFVVGASAGAINGAYFASDPTAAGVAKLESIWRRLTRREVFPVTIGSLLGVFRRRDYLVDSIGLRNLLERHLPYRYLEAAALPIHVVASDIVTGEEVLLSSGMVVDAVLASTAIPGVFPAVQIAGKLLVDGGVANNTPISAAVRLGAERIIVLPTGFACALKHIPRGPVARAMHALSLVIARQLVHDIERFATQVELHVVPPLCPVESSSYDYAACGSLIDRAAENTRRWMAEGGMLATGAPDKQHAH
jgi:NTE family protein